MRASRSQRALVFVPVWAALCSLGGCGYHLGFPAPADVRTVHVAVFDNASRRRELEFDLSRAVIEEIYARTPWRVVADPAAADLVVRGAIEAWDERISVEGAEDEPRSGVSRLRVALQLQRAAAAPKRIAIEVRADFIPRAGVDAIAGISDASLRPVRAELVQLAAERIVMALERAPGEGSHTAQRTEPQKGRRGP